MDNSHQPIIIIKRVKKVHGGHHGGAWKVAYADFVTAMMALFIVLWLLSSSDQVKKAIGGYFSDPTGHGKDVGNGLRGAGGESLDVSKSNVANLKEKLAAAIQNTQAPKKLADHVTMSMTGEGLRIELSEGSQGSFFFQSGSADPSDNGKDLLTILATEIGKLPNKVMMEGHTDANPYSGRKDYTNWELSTDRANAARRWMEGHGMQPEQVTQVRGYAAQKPRTADPLDPENRRITLIVQNTTLDENGDEKKQASEEKSGEKKTDGGSAAKPAADNKTPAKPPAPPAPAAKK